MSITAKDIWGPFSRPVTDKRLNELPQADQEILRRQVALVRARLWEENPNAMKQIEGLYPRGDEARITQLLLTDYVSDESVVERWRAEQNAHPKKTGVIAL